MEVEFIGAAQTVTGSRHVLRTKDATILLDCGLYQGRRKESIFRNRDLGLDPRELDAVVLSHAHIDHSGALPLLVKQGFRGPIYTHNATRDLCAAMLIDAAMIQASDARFINRHIEKEGLNMEPVEPLYDEHDVLAVLDRIVAVPYHQRLPIASGVQLTLLDAGHVLGSALVCIDVVESHLKRRLVFTGDLGRRNMPILRDPEYPEDASVLITESTYGDREHPPIEEMDDELAKIIKRVADRRGKVIIPSFALERAQEIVFALKTLRNAKRIPKIRVYVDSPLTVQLTDVFRLHPECFDEEARALLRGRDNPFVFDELRYVSDKEESKSLNDSHEPAVIISASGMCEGGRILHHLKWAIEDEKNCILIVGYQAPHTLGRRIVERRQKVRVLGVERPLRAEVVVLNGFSAHADQRDLLEFCRATADRGPLEKIVLVHGDPNPQKELASLITDAGMPTPQIPGPGDILSL